MTPLRSRLPAVVLRIAVAALAFLALAPARAGTDSPADRGVVDGSFLERFAPEDGDGTFVEVSLSKPLLELAAQVLEAQDPRLARMVRQLRSVSARVIELPHPDDVRKLQEATRVFREMAGRLRKEGWQPLARVRDGGDEVHVLLLPGGKTVEGLTVMVRSADGELVFANIAGKIDLAQLGELVQALNVPGVDGSIFMSPGHGKKTPGGKDQGTEASPGSARPDEGEDR